jgi:23S rRNA (uracil1939-C5)-methyltransferase
MRRAEVHVDAIAAGGDGVARADGLVVFVPRAAPGDRAAVAFEPKGRFARAQLLELLEPSPVRVEPRCRHYVDDRCGGCQLQHVGYDAQLAVKSRIVADALERIGRRRTEPPAVRASSPPWRYRRKLTLALRRVGPHWIAGLHPYDAPARVFQLEECPITDERVLATWREILAAAEALPRARELRGAVRADEGGASFVLEGGDRWPESDALFSRCPSLGTIWWAPDGGVRRLLHARGEEQPPGASFAQVNATMADALRTHALARVTAHAPTTVVDGYAGLGDTAIALASLGVRVVAIELDRDAAGWCAARLPAGSRAVAGRVEDHLETALPADVVLLNPPRAGVDARVAKRLEQAAATTRAIVYVSCNPATLARDVARMPGWRIASLAAFDMFPQTAHVETVCELVPEAA